MSHLLTLFYLTRHRLRNISYLVIIAPPLDYYHKKQESPLHNAEGLVLRAMNSKEDVFYFGSGLIVSDDRIVA